MPASSAAPATASATATTICRRSTALVYGEDPSEGFVRGRRFLHPKLGFTFTAPPGFTLDNTAQAVLGLKDGGGEAMRLDVVSVPAEQSLPDYLKSGWMDNVDAAERRGVHHQRLPGGDRDRQRRAMVVPAVRRALRQRRLSLHLRGQDHDAAGRPLVPRGDHDVPPHEPEGKRAGQAAAPEGRHRRQERHRGERSRAAWRSITRSSASACSTASARTTASSRARR